MEHLGSVAKEVVVEFFGGAEEKFGVEVPPFKNLVHVASGVRHLLGKPSHAITLPSEFAKYHFTKMDFLHAFVGFISVKYPNPE